MENEIMTKTEFFKLQKEIDSRLVSWCTDVFGGWDNFSKDCFYEGFEFIIPVNCIVPRSVDEWNNAKVGASFSGNNPIELEIVGADSLVVYDGHNRLKTFIANGVFEVKVRFRDFK